MMPPADRIREQNEQDKGRVAHARQEAGSNDFLAVGPVAAPGCLPPGANVCVAAPANQIGS